MKGAASRLRLDAKAHQQIALNAAYQMAILSRAKHPDRVVERFEAAIHSECRPATIAERLIARRDAGAPMAITITKRG